MQFNTPLRYPGGKGRLTQFMGQVIDLNRLHDCHYVEPYAGGAGIALTLLYLEYASVIHLNDISRSVYGFWHSVLHETEALCRLITDTPANMDEWQKQRSVQNDPEASLLDLGFSTFFLNRTNRSGVIRGGVIGGKEQNGAWKLDARLNKANLIRRIERAAAFRGRIRLHNLDAKNLIKDVLPTLPLKTLVYLDPPYYVKGSELYENHYVHEDHADIAQLVRTEIRQHWLVSYDNVPPIRKLYEDFRQVEFCLSYSVGRRYKGSEIMVLGPDVRIPDVIQPSRACAA